MAAPTFLLLFFICWPRGGFLCINNTAQATDILNANVQCDILYQSTELPLHLTRVQPSAKRDGWMDGDRDRYIDGWAVLNIFFFFFFFTFLHKLILRFKLRISSQCLWSVYYNSCRPLLIILTRNYIVVKAGIDFSVTAVVYMFLCCFWTIQLIQMCFFDGSENVVLERKNIYKYGLKENILSGQEHVENFGNYQINLFHFYSL